MKKLLAIILILCCISTFFGCEVNPKSIENTQQTESTSNRTTQETVTSSSTISKSPQGFFDYLKTKGFNIGKETKKEAAMIGADDGKCYDVSGVSVEVYYFNQDKLSDIGKKNFNDAKQYGSINVLENYPTKCVVNGDLVLFNPNGDKSQQIIDAFKGY